MLTVNEITKTIAQIREAQKKNESLFHRTVESNAKKALWLYAAGKGIKINLNPTEPLDDGHANTEENEIYVGSWLKLTIYNTLDYKTIFAAVVAHELGHIATLKPEIDKRRRSHRIFGICNKWVLKSELYASAWALRFLSSFDDIDIKLARKFLKVCYSTYRQRYDPALDIDRVFQITDIRKWDYKGDL